MRNRKFWGIIALIIATGILTGCGVKPYASVYLEPVADGTAAEVDAKTDSIAIQQQGVRITLKPLDEVDLYNLTKDSDINPYINVSTWGNVEPQYTVFEIRIENIDNQRVEIDPASVLVDESGKQYNAVSYADFKELYTDASSYTRPAHTGGIQNTSLSYGHLESLYDNASLQTAAVQNVGYRHYGHHYRYGHRSYRYGHSYRYGYGYPYGYGYGYRGYNTDSYSYNQKKALLFARKTVFDGVKLVSGAKHTGLLVFDRIPSDVKDLKVIVPQVLIIDKNGEASTVDFTLTLRQVIADKG